MTTSSTRPDRRRSTARVFLALAALSAILLGLTPTTAGAAPSEIRGSGSTYVALAMQQWTSEASTLGLKVGYSPQGSPAGLTGYARSLVDFAGTEAEFSALGGEEPARGFQYVPDVAGAVAVMYNASDASGRKVDYLHLTRRTIARIFMGDICSWADPTIKDENKSPALPDGLVLPDHPITLVYRQGQSGTTALFYDFVAHAAPDVFAGWAAKNGFPTNVRIIQLDSSPGFGCAGQTPRALPGSEQIAQYIGDDAQGKWSIGYDEFGYAKVYKVPAAYVKNASGAFTLPYSPNISAALESARLRPDLSQELSGVYDSPDPDAYPISAYSYLVTQCMPTADRPTCKGGYTNAGVTEALGKWMRYIACQGQIQMATIGYSPLPPNLSQEMANAIGRLQGTPPEQLSAANCPNPRFVGNTGPAAPKDVTLVPKGAAAAGSGGPAGANAGQQAAPDAAAGAISGAADPTVAADISVGALKAVGGGSGAWRDASPIPYDRPGSPGSSTLALLLLLGVFLLPPLIAGRRRVRRG